MCNFYEYLAMLEKVFAGSTMKVLLLVVLSVAYPLLADQGAALTAPMLVCFSSEHQLREFAKVINLFNRSTLKSLGVSPRKFELMINAGENLVFVTRFIRGRYTEENLALLEQSCCEVAAERYKEQMKLVLAVGGIPSEFKKWFCGVVYIGGTDDCTVDAGRDKLVREIIYQLEGQGLETILQNTGSNAELGEVYLFHGVAELLMRFLYQKENDIERLTEIDEDIWIALEAINHEWEYADNPQSYVEAFRRLLMAATEWLPEKICDRLELSSEDAKCVDDLMFYDDLFYYFNQADFFDICKPLLQGISFNYLRRQLADAGLLITEGCKRSYWSKETELVTVYGAIIRKRLVKINRALHDRDGEPTFLELVEMKGENSYEEDNGNFRPYGRYIEGSESR